MPGESFWHEARFERAAFSGCDLRRAEFFRTPLAGLDFSSCAIEGLSVSESCAELRGLKIAPEQTPVVAALLGVEIS